MPIAVIVAEADPVAGAELARVLREDSCLAVSAMTGPAEEALRQCICRGPAVLLVSDVLLETVEIRRFREQVNYGRSVAVLVRGSGVTAEDGIRWLRLGCMGYLRSCDGLDRVKRAVWAVSRGEIWAPRAQLALLLRQALDTAECGPQLTVREQEILHLVSLGLSNAEIAARLFISMETVRWHIRRLFVKIGARNRAGVCAVGRRVVAMAHDLQPNRVGKNQLACCLQDI